MMAEGSRRKTRKVVEPGSWRSWIDSTPSGMSIELTGKFIRGSRSGEYEEQQKKLVEEIQAVDAEVAAEVEKTILDIRGLQGEAGSACVRLENEQEERADFCGSVLVRGLKMDSERLDVADVFRRMSGGARVVVDRWEDLPEEVAEGFIHPSGCSAMKRVRRGSRWGRGV